MLFKPNLDTSQGTFDVIEKDGFDWRLLREYFPFTDQKYTEGQYDEITRLVAKKISSKDMLQLFLVTLDIQYECLLSLFETQLSCLANKGDEFLEVGFSQRVAAYLQCNNNVRRDYGIQILEYPFIERLALLKKEHSHLMDVLKKSY